MYIRNLRPVIRTSTILSLAIIGSALTVPLCAMGVGAQSMITTSMTLGPDQIGLVKTAPRISTRVSFREPVTEIICGDLYDPSSGVGSFVVQRVDRDVFIKPIVPKGVSNMFVKTGERGEHMYNFSLVIVAPEQAYVIVNVAAAPTAANSPPRDSDARRRTYAPPLWPPVDGTYNLKAQTADSPVAYGLIDLAEYTNQPNPLPPTLKKDSRPSLAENTKRPEPPPAAPVDASRPNDTLGDPVRRVQAVYPDYAKSIGQQGEVVVLIRVDEKGKVESAEALSGHMLLRVAAVTAARGWRFSQMTAGEVSVKRIGKITFNFQLPTERPITTMRKLGESQIGKP